MIFAGARGLYQLPLHFAICLRQVGPGDELQTGCAESETDRLELHPFSGKFHK